MTLNQLLHLASSELYKAGVPDSSYDARQLLMHAFSIDPSHFLLYKDLELSKAFPETAKRENALRDFRTYIETRSQRKPLQHILGYTYFYGLPFITNDKVLCPRAETELLVEAVLKDLPSIKDRHGSSELNLLDLCTGSGCIAITISVYSDFVNILASDISKDALNVARQNAENLITENNKERKKERGRDLERELSKRSLSKKRLDFLFSDLFTDIPKYLKAHFIPGFDIIVSNPPYIPSPTIQELEPEVKYFDPDLALDGGDDGLDFYRIIAMNSPDFLRPDGFIYLEIGHNQKKAVSKLLSSHGFTDIQSKKDLSGLDRLIIARHP